LLGVSEAEILEQTLSEVFGKDTQVGFREID